MIYVDEVFEADPLDYAGRNPRAHQAARWGTKWCHMWASTPEDIPRLHEIAAAIGLKRAYFQERAGASHRRRFPHYDLIPSKRKQALAAGATARSLRDWLREEMQKERLAA